jgi:hypothetical protein
VKGVKDVIWTSPEQDSLDGAVVQKAMLRFKRDSRSMAHLLNPARIFFEGKQK